MGTTTGGMTSDLDRVVEITQGANSFQMGAGTDNLGKKGNAVVRAAWRWFNELSAQGILLTDAELNIRGWNQWLESHTGQTAAAIIGRNLLDIYPDLITRQLDGYYKDALAGQIRVISQRLHGYLLAMPSVPGDASFEQMQQSARIAPLIEGERIIGTITVIEDVTERVEREDQLVRLLGREKAARAEAETANRAKDEFLATVSHELRTPLNSISGWVQLLRNGKLEGKDSKHALDAIQRGVTAQTRLIEDILDASRIITGKLHLDFGPVDLVSVIDAALDTVRPAAVLKQVELVEDLNRRCGLVSGDPNRLQQVVCNLLSNSIKFTPNGGRIEIVLERVGSQAEIRLKDTGQGIDPAFLPYVFDRFRQANSTSARKHGGLGLGLAIVRYLVEMHGGKVHATSDGEGLGSTFTVRLPVMEIAQSGDPRDLAGVESEDRDSLAGPVGVRLLIVDDEPDAREMLHVMFEQHGFETRTAATAREALEVLDEWVPDVLVSDIGMPSEDGYALIGKVRALEPERGGHIPAVALTGYAGSEDRQRLLSAGYQICVAKPADFAELTRTVVGLAGRPSTQ
ncbi:MAG: ATP-binding protein [Blastocatellia bacterium]